MELWKQVTVSAVYVFLNITLDTQVTQLKRKIGEGHLCENIFSLTEMYSLNKEKGF